MKKQYEIKKIVISGRTKNAIFEKDTEVQASQVWDSILRYGLIREESPYYIAKEEGKYAIFHIDKPNDPISKWWDHIYLFGIIRGSSSEYYAVGKIDNNLKKQAIFHKDNPEEPVSDWIIEPFQIVSDKQFVRYIEKIKLAEKRGALFMELLVKNNIKMKDFAKFYNIPYSTAQSWFQGAVRTPRYMPEMVKHFIQEQEKKLLEKK